MNEWMNKWMNGNHIIVTIRTVINYDTHTHTLGEWVRVEHYDYNLWMIFFFFIPLVQNSKWKRKFNDDDEILEKKRIGANQLTHTHNGEWVSENFHFFSFFDLHDNCKWMNECEKNRHPVYTWHCHFFYFGSSISADHDIAPPKKKQIV